MKFRRDPAAARRGSETERPADDPERAGGSVVGGTAFLATTQVVASGLSYLGTAIIARTIGPAAWGGFSLVLSLATLVGVIFDLQVGRRVLQELLDDDSDEGGIIGSLVTLRILAGLVAGLCVFGFLALGGYPTDVVWAGAMAVLILTVASAGSGLQIFFQARIMLRPIGVALVASRLLFLGLVVVFIAAGVRSIAALLVCTVVLEIASLIVKVLIARRHIRIKLAFEPRQWMQWGRESVLVATGAALGSVAYRVDAILLSQQDTLAAVGQYGVAYKFADLLEPISSAMVAPVLTLLVMAWPGDRDQFRRSFQGAFTLFAAAAVVPTALMALFADQVTVLLYGDDYAASATAARILVAAVGLAFFRRLAVSTLIAVDRHRTYLVASLIAAVTNLVLNLLVIPRFSFAGAAATTLATEVLQLIILFWGLRVLGDAVTIDWRSLRSVAIGIPVIIATGALIRLVAPWPVAALVATAAYLLTIHVVGLGRPGGLRAVPKLLGVGPDGSTDR